MSEVCPICNQVHKDSACRVNVGTVGHIDHGNPQPTTKHDELVETIKNYLVNEGRIFPNSAQPIAEGLAPLIITHTEQAIRRDERQRCVEVVKKDKSPANMSFIHQISRSTKKRILEALKELEL